VAASSVVSSSSARVPLLFYLYRRSSYFKRAKGITLFPHANSGAWLLFLLLVQSKQRHTGHLDALEPDPGNVPHGVAGSPKPGYQHLVVFVHVVEAAIPRHERRDLLPVLNQLNADALPNGRVRLLGLNSDLLHHDALCHGGPAHGVGLHGCDGVGLGVLLVAPALDAPVGTELAPGSDTLGFSHISIVEAVMREGVALV